MTTEMEKKLNGKSIPQTHRDIGDQYNRANLFKEVYSKVRVCIELFCLGEDCNLQITELQRLLL